MPVNWSFEADLDGIVARVGDGWESLRGARIFMTGGTGFIGHWLLASLAAANERHRLDVEVTVLTRDPAAVARKMPQVAAYPAFHFVAGDVLALEAKGDRYSHLLHAATDASAHLTEHDPRRMFDTVVTGTRRALDFAVACGAKRFFFFSSGAVYGNQPPAVSHVDESYLGGPDPRNPRAAYAEGKRAAEMLCAIYGKQFGLDVVNARIFALLGPLLSLDIHFAAGNFIRDAMAGKPIVVESAGTAVRSYLYAADLAVWLWAILLKAAPNSVYNVGSEEGVSIADLARRTASVLGAPGAQVLGREDIGWNPGRYVPSSARIRRDLGVTAETDLDSAIKRTAMWNGWNA